MEKQKVLEIENMTVHYKNSTSPVLENFSLVVREKEICCLVGESGSGKTTVIRALYGNLSGDGKMTAEAIRFKGKSLLGNTDDAWRRIRGTDISMIFQDSGAMMDPIRTIGSQFVEYICEHSQYTKKEAWAKGEEMLRKVRFSDEKRIMNSYPFQLSGGMCQRMGIAFAMFFQPELLLADEPTSALDVTTQAQIIGEMMKLREDYGTSILMITHNLALAAYLSDYILVMKDGKIIEQGDREKILQHPEAPYTKKLLQAVPSIGGYYDV